MSKITVVDYLIQEIQKLGVKDIFGLPGDYNFKILKAIQKNYQTNWIGCTNELNAGYAADGYARINGCGALVTTYGVGELSAVNAIAGCFAEFVPVIKIAGLPETKYINSNAKIHHNFSNPDYKAYTRIFSNITAAQAFLDSDNAKAEIDRVLSILVKEKQPVYIALPSDVCDTEIENTLNIQKPSSNADSLQKAAKHILNLLENARKPVIIADILTERFEALSHVKNLIKTCKYPTTTLLMGKGMIDSDTPEFIGTYNGSQNNLETYSYVNSSDCPVCIGAIFNDWNTFGFDIKFNPSDFIEIQGTYTIVQNKRYDGVLMKELLEELTKNIAPKQITMPAKNPQLKLNEATDNKLTFNYLYPRLQKFLQPEDIIFNETGIMQFGTAQIEFPPKIRLHNQAMWGSIGWATPAAFGACIAAKDKRIILLTGEGSHQLTAQAVSSLMRFGLKPIIFVLNNGGYTIERLLSKDPMDTFNDIASWSYTKLPNVFEGNYWCAQAKTEKELDEILEEAQEKQKKKMCYIELFTEKMDLPFLTQRIIMKQLSENTDNRRS